MVGLLPESVSEIFSNKVIKKSKVLKVKATPSIEKTQSISTFQETKVIFKSFIVAPGGRDYIPLYTVPIGKQFLISNTATDLSEHIGADYGEVYIYMIKDGITSIINDTHVGNQGSANSLAQQFNPPLVLNTGDTINASILTNGGVTVGGFLMVLGYEREKQLPY